MDAGIEHKGLFIIMSIIAEEKKINYKRASSNVLGSAKAGENIAATMPCLPVVVLVRRMPALRVYGGELLS